MQLEQYKQFDYFKIFVLLYATTYFLKALGDFWLGMSLDDESIRNLKKKYGFATEDVEI